jgi:diguanylate cyclase
VIVDLDHFGAVNDTLGHDNGDEYLRAVADALTRAVRPDDRVARLGGDDFGLLLPDADRSTIEALIRRVQTMLAADVEIGGVPISTEVHIGCACWPHDADTPRDLLRRADIALHAAKGRGADVQAFEPALEHFDEDRLSLVGQLRRAIEHDELTLQYQPKFDLASGRVDAVEALVRWNHPARGLLWPSEFLDVVESTGLIRPLTQWVVDHAVRQVARWRAEGVDLGVAVNISARNLREDDLGATILERLAHYSVDPERLTVEVTETAVVADPVRAAELLLELRRNGVRVSLDDFGEGYTSLGQLRALPLSEIKVDRRFVAPILHSEEDAALVEMIVGLGHRLGLEVVAEGAESPAAVERLRSIGCDVAQGWALSPALGADEARAVAATCSGGSDGGPPRSGQREHTGV